ncbi:protein DEPP1 [Pteropus alecto]|uniref:protein DEPP1 n=1 Tax=Pteropus alecto TaxID=9402 RepID=UPI0003F12FE5|nr:protein DEPP1 [Pteropus alecto]
MRSRLLISVAHLPTIRESQEEMLPGGLRQEPPTSPSLDDYVRSICQLAQPTSVLDKPAAKDRLRRPHWPAWASEESFPTRSPYDITTHSSTQQPTLPEAGTADPLDWLFGKSQEKKPSWRDKSRRTGFSADPWVLPRQIDSRKAQGVLRRRLCDARVQGHSLERPSWDWHLGFLASGKHDQAAAFPASSCPSSVLRTLYLHLPVIHEL